jgi:hypothetical protein
MVVAEVVAREIIAEEDAEDTEEAEEDVEDTEEAATIVSI